MLKIRKLFLLSSSPEKERGMVAVCSTVKSFFKTFDLDKKVSKVEIKYIYPNLSLNIDLTVIKQNLFYKAIQNSFKLFENRKKYLIYKNK